MPLDDWSRVPHNVFHNFHTGWLWNIARVLNLSVLPQGYVARTEEYVGPYEADVLALETGRRAASSPRPEHAPVPTLTIAPPRFVPRKERRVSVFSAQDERRVAVIEVVSPGNKDSRNRVDWFDRKLVEYVEGGLHLMMIALFPGTGVPPEGFGAIVTRELGATTPLPTAERQVVSLECQDEPPEVRVYATELTLGASFPDAPLFLEPGLSVAIPLDPTYAETVGGLPQADRDRLGA